MFHLATGDTDATDAGEVGANGVDVCQVVLQRIVGKLADPACRTGTDWTDDGVDGFEGLAVILLDQGASL